DALQHAIVDPRSQMYEAVHAAMGAGNVPFSPSGQMTPYDTRSPGYMAQSPGSPVNAMFSPILFAVLATPIQSCLSIVLADESLVLADIPILLSDESLILAGIPLILADKSFILADVPILFSDVPFILADESLVLSDVPILFSDKSLVLADESLVLSD
ncbi:hypothetical protein EV182_008687, partial [Spiromyces aspiralis]